MTMKLTFLFRDGSTGWSETYYIAGNYSGLQNTFLKTFAEKRAALMGLSATVIGVRASDAEQPKLSRPYKLDYPGSYAVVQSPAVLAEQPHVAALVKFTTSTGAQRILTLPGVPDEAIQRTSSTGDSETTGDYDKKIRLFTKWLTSGTNALQIRQRQVLDPYNPVNIEAVTEHTDGAYKIQHPGAVVYTVGMKVALTKVKGNNLAGAKGIRKVKAVTSPTTFTIDTGPLSDRGEVIYLGGGKFARVAYQFVDAIEAEEPIWLSTRKRGRPFSRRRGRRSHRR